MGSVRLRHLLALLAVLCFAGIVAPSASGAGVTPKTVQLEIDPGESAQVAKSVDTERLPPNSDFVFLADNTGSMGSAIANVKANAQNIIDAIEAAGATDARYGVANYQDFTSGAPCPYGFELDTDLTNATAAKTAINTWGADSGCDTPEANLFALHMLADHSIDWREDSARFVIWFGDAPGHDPVCPAVSGHPHNVTEASATADLQSEEIHVIAVTASLAGGGLDGNPNIGFDYGDCGEAGTAGQATRIATATGGVHLVNPPASSISTTIINAINALPPVPVQVTPVAACDPGLTVTNDPATRTVPSGGTATFDETIAVAADVALGSVLHCSVDFTINGASAGPDYRQEITVRVGVGVPTDLALTPKTATNPVDTEHCVTATVTDAFGDPVANTAVDFVVSGTDSDGGTVSTDADGQAEFCYIVGPLPGEDLITATAQEGTQPSDTATKTIVLPESTAGCKVTYGGKIVAANGDKATLGGNAKVPASGPQGQQEYQDHGPVANLNVHSITVDAVVCTQTSASIFGTATVNGEGPVNYRIDVRDVAEPGANDRYRIRLSTGYDSGDQQIIGGNVQIH